MTSVLYANAGHHIDDKVGAGVPGGLHAEGDVRSDGHVHAVHNVLGMVPVPPGVHTEGHENKRNGEEI